MDDELGVALFQETSKWGTWKEREKTNAVRKLEEKEEI